MKIPAFHRALMFTLFGACTAASHGAATVDEKVVGTTETVQFMVSERGAHAAAVVRKGSRWVVTVDGVAGPKFDEILNASSQWVDPRPQRGWSNRPNFGHHAVNQYTTASRVAFSFDGSHFAYVARQSQEWVVVEDNREVLRLPLPPPGTAFRLQFIGENGKHFLFAKDGEQLGSELWLDGQKLPFYYRYSGSSDLDSSDPIFSPDGEHIAYTANVSQDKRTLIIDGKDAGYPGEKLTFSDDGKYLISEVTTPKGTALVVNGKALLSANWIANYFCAPVTHRIAAVLGHRYPDGTQGQFVWIDGKPVEATLCKAGVKQFLFSPDGKHYAAVCDNGPNIQYVVTDGKKGQEYSSIGFALANGTDIGFSPDSSRLVYVANSSNKLFLVSNGEESDDSYDTLAFRFCPVNSRLAYLGGVTSKRELTLVVDGKPTVLAQGGTMDSFDFSPDGSHWAIQCAVGSYGGEVYFDGIPMPITAMSYWFSPDGKHLAIAGYKAEGDIHGLWIDGTLVYKGNNHPRFLTFSADSQHVFWMVTEPDPTRTNGNYSVHVTYADGEPVVRADALTQQSISLIVPPGYAEFTVHPGWQTIGDTGLGCLAPLATGEVKRYLITPVGTSVASVIANAQAAEAAAAAAKPKGKK